MPYLKTLNQNTSTTSKKER